MDLNLKIKHYQSKDDITWKQYTEFAESTSEDADEQFITNRILKIFYDIKPSVARDLTANQINELIGNVIIALNKPPSKFRQTFLIDGEEYGFFDFSKIKYGELVDLDTLREEGDWLGITSICYRKITKKMKDGQYLIEPYKGYDSKLMKDIPMSYVEGFQLLFTKSLNHLSQIILDSTQQ